MSAPSQRPAKKADIVGGRSSWISPASCGQTRPSAEPCARPHSGPRRGLASRAARCRGRRGIAKIWSGQQDLNLRPEVPKTSALPGCAIPRFFARVAIMRGECGQGRPRVLHGHVCTRTASGWIPTRSATPSTALVPQRKVGFLIPNAGLLRSFQGTKTARREGISSPFSDAGGCTSPQNSGRAIGASRLCNRTLPPGRRGAAKTGRLG